jgi:hypothetical protein
MDTCDAPLVVTVVDEDDLPVPNVTVVLSGDGSSRTYLTDWDGIVRFERPPVSWAIDALSDRGGGFSIEGGTCADLDYVARIDLSDGCSLAVIDPGPAVMPEVTTRGWTHGQELLQKLPGPRTPETFLLLTPGVVPTRNGLSVAGAPLAEVEWRIDGVLVSDPVTGGWTPELAGPVAIDPRQLPGLPPPRR